MHAGARPLEILLVEDEADIAGPLAELLEDQGHRVRVEHDGHGGLARLRQSPYDLMISDIRLPKMDGLELFDWVQRNTPATSVVLMSAYGSIPEAVSALRKNAVHYLRKPFEIDELLEAVDQVAERVLIHSSRDTPSDAKDPVGSAIIGVSPVMSALVERLAAIAASEASVLIHGETGSGKEVVAQAIHRASSRRNGPFIAVNCGALPDSLVESELFGHERGAFTGALQRRDGKFVAASGGTIFLDEVTEMPLPSQVKLLRVLQERVVRPVGSNKYIETDVRVLAATNGNLREILREGAFREDLFYRLKVLDVHLPPLRERRADLPLLVGQFLHQFADPEKDPPRISAYAWALLRRYPFPGNVRELQHAIHHAVVLSGGEVIQPQHLPDDIRGTTTRDRRRPRLSEAMAGFEEEFILRTLEEAGWSKTRAAELLGISRKNLWEKLKRYEVQVPRRSKPPSA